MTPAARLSAAIDVIAAIDAERVPAANALKEWGRAHRFAGSGDRAAIAGLVFDVLRRRASSAWLMGGDTPRARMLGMLRLERGATLETVAALCDGSRFAPPPLTEAERQAFATRSLADAPAPVAGDYPDWLDAHFAEVFGDERVAEAAAMASRAPLDLRVNTLKASRDKILGRLSLLGAVPTPWSPLGLRIALGADARNPGIHAEEDFIKGHIEVQDEGSQLAALLSAAQPGEQVIDLCAGAGGKTLALSAIMQNTGQIHAYDSDRMQLRPIFERLKRAGTRNVQVMMAGQEPVVRALGPRFDLVFVDAPCTGSGVWRRRPDAKWRVKPQNLTDRIADQRAVLDLGSALVKPGGRLVYVTCSLLPEENQQQAAAFVERHPEFQVEPFAERWRSSLETPPPDSADGRDDTLLLTPARHATDGFFIASFQRRA